MRHALYLLVLLPLLAGCQSISVTNRGGTVMILDSNGKSIDTGRGAQASLPLIGK